MLNVVEQSLNPVAKPFVARQCHEVIEIGSMDGQVTLIQNGLCGMVPNAQRTAFHGLELIPLKPLDRGLGRFDVAQHEIVPDHAYVQHGVDVAASVIQVLPLPELHD